MCVEATVESEDPDAEREMIHEVPGKVACGTCGGAVYWSGVAPGQWRHFSNPAEEHRAWVPA